MLVARLPKDAAGLSQQTDEWPVGVHPQLARNVGDLRQESPTVVEAHDEGDPGGRGHTLIVLAVRGRLMDDPRAVAGRDVVVDEDAPGIARAPRVGVGVVVEEAIVGDVGQVGAEEGLRHRLAGLLG